MKRKLLFMCVALFTIKGYTQDSIVNYLDRKGKSTTMLLAKIIETKVKKEDSIWEHSRYDYKGKLRSIHYHKTKESKKKVGQSIIYTGKGVMISLSFNDINGLKEGKDQTWFYDGSRGSDGRYIKDKREGLWMYYHFNGNIASKLYYKNDSILKSIIYDETGKKINKELVKNKKATFKGGKKKFYKKVKKIVNNIGYKVKGKVYVNFIIDVDGRIKNVSIENKLEKKLEKQIIAFFENIKGWSPVIHMNRKYPRSYNITLNFSK